MSHGHVRPNPDGTRARCGGPGICDECKKELMFAFKDIGVILDKIRFIRDRKNELGCVDVEIYLASVIVDLNRLDKLEETPA